MAHEITTHFYCTKRNARKLKGIAEDFSQCYLAEDSSEPCIVIINKESYPEDLKLFAYFWDIIRKYKTTAMYADEELLTREQTESILNWIRCYCNRECFDDQTDYCCISPGLKSLHGWGCKWLHSIMRHGRFGRHHGLPWYKVGPFDDNIQYIDKQAIKDKLEDEARVKCLRLCPLFSMEKAFQYVDLLPDQIDPKVDTEWAYDLSEDPENKFAALGVRPNSDNAL